TLFGSEVVDGRHAPADALEIVDGPWNFGGVGDGQEMQRGIGGAARGHDDRHRVFDGFAGDDVARPHAAPHGIDQHAGGLGGRGDFFVVFVSHGAGIRQAHAHGFEGRTHGVGGVHAAARTRAGNGAFFDLTEIFAVHAPHGELADGFEHGHDREILPFIAARLDGAAIHVDAWHVHAGQRDHAAGHVLVAAADDHDAVHPLALHGGLDTVGN